MDYPVSIDSTLEETEGFEPSDPLQGHFLSREASSAAPASLLSGMESQARVELANGCFADSSLIRLGTAT